MPPKKRRKQVKRGHAEGSSIDEECSPAIVLPPHIMQEITTHLSVASLASLRAVSKDWAKVASRSVKQISVRGDGWVNYKLIEEQCCLQMGVFHLWDARIQYPSLNRLASAFPCLEHVQLHIPSTSDAELDLSQCHVVLQQLCTLPSATKLSCEVTPWPTLTARAAQKTPYDAVLRPLSQLPDLAGRLTQLNLHGEALGKLSKRQLSACLVLCTSLVDLTLSIHHKAVAPVSSLVQLTSLTLKLCSDGRFNEADATAALQPLSTLRNLQLLELSVPSLPKESPLLSTLTALKTLKLPLSQGVILPPAVACNLQSLSCISLAEDFLEGTDEEGGPPQSGEAALPALRALSCTYDPTAFSILPQLTTLSSLELHGNDGDLRVVKQRGLCLTALSALTNLQSFTLQHVQNKRSASWCGSDILHSLTHWTCLTNLTIGLKLKFEQPPLAGTLRGGEEFLMRHLQDPRAVQTFRRLGVLRGLQKLRHLDLNVDILPLEVLPPGLKSLRLRNLDVFALAIYRHDLHELASSWPVTSGTEDHQAVREEVPALLEQLLQTMQASQEHETAAGSPAASKQRRASSRQSSRLQGAGRGSGGGSQAAPAPSRRGQASEVLHQGIAAAAAGSAAGASGSGKGSGEGAASGSGELAARPAPIELCRLQSLALTVKCLTGSSQAMVDVLQHMEPVMLPERLTSLSYGFSTGDGSAKHLVSCKIASLLQRLTSLQELHLTEVFHGPPADASLLSRLTQLRELHFELPDTMTFLPPLMATQLTTLSGLMQLSKLTFGDLDNMEVSHHARLPTLSPKQRREALERLQEALQERKDVLREQGGWRQ